MTVPDISLPAIKTPSALRTALLDMVIKDLLGPAGGPEEELDPKEDRASQHHLGGMLSPKRNEISGSEMDELATASNS